MVWVQPSLTRLTSAVNLSTLRNHLIQMKNKARIAQGELLAVA